MPDNVLSSTSVPARFVGARGLGVTKTVDYNDGGIAINDPSLGLKYQRWRARIIDYGTPESAILLSAKFVEEYTLLSIPYMTEVSFSFDQNMQICFTYVAGGSSYLYWFDPSLGAYTTINLGASVITPRVDMDDKRLIGTQGYQTNDLILAYVIGDQLFYRQQRDRFLTQRMLLSSGAQLGIVKIGMSRNLRFQFQLEVK